MKHFLKFFFKTREDSIEEYLAQSTSLQDLERRQQELMRSHRFL